MKYLIAQYINRHGLQWTTVAPLSATDAHAQQVTAQAIDFLYRSLPSIIISITLMPIVMTLIMWRHMDRRVLIGWCVVSFAITAARLLLNRAYMRRTPATMTASISAVRKCRRPAPGVVR